ncbi:phytanoyl-CoA dioxygenase family protein [Amycolatopsis alba]|uniref:Phytanoyl-CoA dioxygenase n=1 Tax=Amycolatopsis alba DSM 44262 TaxID=1125972 RepID=A0A229RN91_AMYAL|nr:phytanoyl-CoA dioxygenase family protein [Amycolatopsis alba]OXM47959.1 phytanoyl-CoA dioxygenase [Amycolatopsis alba DSM 44262]
MTPTTATGDLLPTAEDVAFYAEHGWWTSDVVIPDEVLETAQLGAERHYAGERDHELLITGGYLDWRPQHGDVIRLNDYVSLQNDDLRQLVDLPVIAGIAARLAGTDQIRLFHDQLICKPAGMAPSESTVGWHVDAAYWQTCSSRDMLTAWIPFQDCDDDIGAISFVDGSHRRDDTEWMRTFTEHDMTELERSFAGAAPVHKVPLRIKRGQVSFHHCRTIHGSDANRSSRDRVALALHFQDRANRYVPHTDSSRNRTVHINDLLCRKDDAGLPDYADPDICPVLWPV